MVSGWLVVLWNWMFMRMTCHPPSWLMVICDTFAWNATASKQLGPQAPAPAPPAANLAVRRFGSAACHFAPVARPVEPCWSPAEAYSGPAEQRPLLSARSLFSVVAAAEHSAEPGSVVPGFGWSEPDFGFAVRLLLPRAPGS